MVMLIGRKHDVGLVSGHFVPGVWHAAFVGNKPATQRGILPPLKPKVEGLLPLCGASMMTGYRGMQNVSLGEPTCLRCRKKLGLA